MTSGPSLSREEKLSKEERPTLGPEVSKNNLFSLEMSHFWDKAFPGCRRERNGSCPCANKRCPGQGGCESWQLATRGLSPVCGVGCGCDGEPARLVQRSQKVTDMTEAG